MTAKSFDNLLRTQRLERLRALNAYAALDERERREFWSRAATIERLAERRIKDRPRPYRVYGGTKHWPAFKVARWRMTGELGSLAIWFDGKSSDSGRMIESLRLLIIKEYEEKFGAVDCEPEVTFLDVPKEKDRFLDFLNQFCSR